MKSFDLRISTPDGSVFEGRVVKLDLRGLLGDLAVMAGHMPFMTAVQPGNCRLLLEDGSERNGHLVGGLLSVSNEETSLLASGFKWID